MLKELITQRDKLETSIAEALSENVGKCFYIEHFTGDITIFHVEEVPKGSLKSYKGISVQRGESYGIILNTFLPSYMIIEGGQEIPKEEFDRHYYEVLAAL